MLRRRRLCLLAALFSTTVISQAVEAQTSLPMADPRFEGQVGRTYLDSDPAPYPAGPTAPQGAPNIVLILLDDVGFGQFSAFGGAVPSPGMERLAGEGIVYNRFHTAGICSPTRAALLTGRNPHQAGFGLVGELATGYDGYVGELPRSTATIARVLQLNGYATAMFGKNHNTPSWEGGPAGPFNHWPTGMGFDYFYGFNGWGTSQWEPALVENTRAIAPAHGPNYQLTGDLVDHAISWMQAAQSTQPDKPFFLYLATGATHAPHQAPADWIDRFKGQFDAGWDAYREATFKRQKALGVIPRSAELTPRPANIAAWDSLDAHTRKVLARQMEVFAGFGAYTDHEVGRLLDAVAHSPAADNTLIVYVVGDNGASAEGGPIGEINEVGPANGLGTDSAEAFTPEVVEALGGPRYNNNFAWGWAWAMNTPFRYYKQVVSHLGATRNPLIVAWPGHIQHDGKVRSQFLDVTDIAPTLLDAAGLPMPDRVDGIAQKTLEGISMRSTFDDAQAPELRHTQYFEVFSNRAIYHDGWMASAPLAVNPAQPNRKDLNPDDVHWELYDLRNDFTQATDLAQRDPDQLHALENLWWAQAGANQVLPLDWRAAERLIGAQRPDPTRGRQDFTYHPGMVGLPESIAPKMKNRSWTIKARGVFSAEDRGMLITQGGRSGGWALYLQDGHLVYDYNYAELREDAIHSDVPVPEGTRELGAHFAYDGKGPNDRGRGGTLTLKADGKVVGSGHLDSTLSGLFSITDGLDVGADYGSPVSDAYPMPFAFTGALEAVDLHLE